MAEIRQRAFGMRGVTITGRGGVATTDPLPQMAFRLGGLQTVRGFNYGTYQGQAFWSMQGDWTPFKGQVRPVVFADVGQAGALGSVFSQKPLVGIGAGLSFFNGIARFDFSVPLQGPASGLRFDIQFGAPR
jgi:hemolysin activation/secretion protein